MLVWVLKDNRPGNYSQSINLADCLKANYEIKEISYNKLASLPNSIKLGRLSTIDKDSKNNLINQKKKPNVIISAGRRSALIALDLRKMYPNLFLINIMNPGSSIIKKFDLVIAPKHDKIRAKNVIDIIGSVVYIKEKSLKEDYQKFAHIFDKIKSPKIALLVGGSSKNAQFKMDDALKIRKITDKLCQNMNAGLMVTTSRRTDQFIIDSLKKKNENIKYFFQWEENKENPYKAILQAADYIIVTGDSIAMCCEACYVGKPVYVYSNDNICSRKHLKFQKTLFDNGFASKLTYDLEEFDRKKVNKLDEISKILPEIKKILKNGTQYKGG